MIGVQKKPSTRAVLRFMGLTTKKQQWRAYKAGMGQLIRKRLKAGGTRRRFHTKPTPMVLLERE